MPRFVPVSPEYHANKAWRRPPSFAFAAGEAITSLTGGDLAQVALTAPIAFVLQDDVYIPVMVMSPAPGQNLFVSPQGQWLGGYAPAELRGYPFRLFIQPGTDQASLFVDEDSGLVVDAGAKDGEAFFAQDGQLSASLQPVMDFLAQTERSRLAITHATKLLGDAGVIQPWTIKIKGDTGGETTATGLYRVDENALGTLSAEDFLTLRTALPLAYTQMLSTGQLGVFERLLKLRSAAHPAAAKPTALVEQILKGEDDGILRFD